MIDFVKKHFVALLLASGVVFVIVASLVSMLFPQKFPPATEYVFVPDILRVEPLQNTSKVGPVPDFVVYFDGEVKIDSVSLKSDPKLDFSKQKKGEGKFIFRPQSALKPETDYQLTVLVKGEPKFNWKIKTKAFSVTSPTYAIDVNKAKAAIPYKTANVNLSYDPPLDQYFAYISGRPTAIFEEEVKRWFASFGVKDTSPLSIITIAVNKF